MSFFILFGYIFVDFMFSFWYYFFTFLVLFRSSLMTKTQLLNLLHECAANSCVQESVTSRSEDFVLRVVVALNYAPQRDTSSAELSASLSQLLKAGGY